MNVCQGIVRHITDHPDGDNFALESIESPGEYVGTLTGPNLWLEDHLGKAVCVIVTDQHFSITVIGEKQHGEFDPRSVADQHPDRPGR